MLVTSNHLIPGIRAQNLNLLTGMQVNNMIFWSGRRRTNNFDQNFPHWKGRGFVIKGFAWWQGRL